MQEPRISPTTALVSVPCPECGAPHRADGQHTLDGRTDTWICRRSNGDQPAGARKRTRPATAQDFHRLADLAHERGLHLFRDGSRWFCSSASDRGGCHYVTGFSCTCQGFVAHQRCTHHALLLERLGWLPEVEPDLPYVEASPIDCPDCCGCGVQDFGRYALPCETCKGTGVKPDHRLAGQPVVQIVATAA